MNTQQNVCLACGRVISGDEPGICNVCAEFATEVQFPVLVRQVVPETSVINPEDLHDQPHAWNCAKRFHGFAECTCFKTGVQS